MGYHIEGFADPTMSAVFNDLLMVKSPTHRKRVSEDRSRSGSGSGSCKKTSESDQKPISLLEDNTSEGKSTSFLKSILIQQKETADSLMSSAKKIGPVAKKITQMEQAYDAAFESDIQAAQPKLGSTLQGFILIFFLCSFVVLTIVSTMMVNMMTDSMRQTLMTFVMFLVLGIVGATLIIQFG